MADADLSGAVLDGRYKVIEPLAEGAMGSVYRGERVKLGRAVAIKVMHQELPDELASRQRFEREAKLMALLEHPNCVSVIDFGVHDDKPFLVMDLVRGTSLGELLDNTGVIELARAADIIRQVLSGLAHAHELGIVHRDIKPANIMISEKAGLGQQVRILDFGLARFTEGSTKLTTGIVVGTPNYMAPEQCKGGDIDARTDLYACGVMLFEMLTGRKPFLADDPLQVVRKHLLEPPPTLASVEPRVEFGELEAVIAKALAKAPGDRYESAVEMAKAIEAAAAKQSRTRAAALFGRAVPDGATPVGSQLATMSGWNVPQGAQAPGEPGAGVAPPAPGAAMTPPAPSAPVAAAPAAVAATPASSKGHEASAGSSTSLPVGDSAVIAAFDASAGSSTSLPVGESAVIAAFDASAGASASLPAVESARSAEPGGSLPPLPKAAPYVPPPGIGTAAGAPDSAFVGGAAPIGPMSIPPTRPASAPAQHPIPQLPFTKKQLAIGAGGLFALIILIALIAGGGSSKHEAANKPQIGAGSAIVTPEEPKGDPVPDIIERATALLASEDYEGAVSVLRRARKDHPDSAELAFLAGKAYFAQLWWSDGVENFRDAIKLDESYKENPELLKAVLKGFLTTPDVDDRIVSFMRHGIGPPMRPYLEETAEKHPKKALRARARAELDAGR